MSALENTPTNPNFLSPLNFKFSIKRAPHINFFIQKIGIPSLSLPTYESPNPFVKIPEPGNYELTFTEAYPTDLSELVFDTTKSDVEYIEATATFKYLLFEIINI